MRSKTMQIWMNNEMERLTMKLERYKPTGSGYNRIKPMLLSKSVTHMLNNPIPPEEKINRCKSSQAAAAKPTETRTRGILSRSNSEWEEVYPSVKFSRNNSKESNASECQKSFAFYRNCSTRIT